MTVSSNEQVVFKDYPLILWLMGMLFLFVGAPSDVITVIVQSESE